MTLCAIYDTIHQAKNAASYACYDLYLYQVGTLARTNNVVVFYSYFVNMYWYQVCKGRS